MVKNVWWKELSLSFTDQRSIKEIKKSSLFCTGDYCCNGGRIGATFPNKGATAEVSALLWFAVALPWFQVFIS